MLAAIHEEYQTRMNFVQEQIYSIDENPGSSLRYNTTRGEPTWFFSFMFSGDAADAGPADEERQTE